MRSIYLLSLAILLLPVSAFSQNTEAQDNARIITFNEAIDQALSKNVTIRVEQNNLRVNKARSLEGIGLFLPTVNGSANLGIYNGNQQVQDGETVRFINQTTNGISSSINASMPVFAAGRRWKFLKSANLNFDAQEKLLERTRQDVIFNVALQYMQALLDWELYRIARENLVTQEVQLKRIDGLVEAGARPIVDKYNQQAEYNRLELEMIRSQNAYQNDLSLLAQTMMLDPLTEFQVDSVNLSVDKDVYEGITFEELYNRAVENRPDLKRLQLIHEAARADMAVAKTAYYPTVNAFGYYSSNYNDGQAGSFNQQFFTTFLNSGIGLSVNVPIFNNFSTRRDVVTNRVAAENAELREMELLRQIQTDLKQTYLDYQAARKSYMVNQTRLEAAELAFESTAMRYNLGTATIVEYTTANNALVEAQANLAQAEATLMFQDILMAYQTGTLAVNGID